MSQQSSQPDPKQEPIQPLDLAMMQVLWDDIATKCAPLQKRLTEEARLFKHRFAEYRSWQLKAYGLLLAMGFDQNVCEEAVTSWQFPVIPY